jgi:hypothetical protein
LHRVVVDVSDSLAADPLARFEEIMAEQ